MFPHLFYGRQTSCLPADDSDFSGLAGAIFLSISPLLNVSLVRSIVDLDDGRHAAVEFAYDEVDRQLCDSAMPFLIQSFFPLDEAAQLHLWVNLLVGQGGS